MTQSLSLVDLPEHNAARRGDAPAFILEDGTLSHRAFAKLVSGSEAFLRAQGIAAGDRIAVWMVNRPEWLALLLAACRIGAALVAINTRYRAHEVAHLLELSKARLLVMEPRFRNVDFAAILDTLGHDSRLARLEKIVVYGAVATTQAFQNLAKPVIPLGPDTLATASPPSPTVKHALELDAPCILFSTSGTTSRPKLVAHSRAAIAEHSSYVAGTTGLQAPDAQLLATLPFAGVFGFSAALAALTAGTPIVLMHTFDAPRAIVMMRRHRITHLFGSDEMFTQLLAQGDIGGAFESVRIAGYAAFNSGAAALAKSAWSRGLPLVGLYGSSEVQALFAIQSPTLPMDKRVEAGGFPSHPKALVRIRDLASGALLPHGQLGRLQIQSPTYFIGYLEDAVATDQVVDAEGFFDTGDLGYTRGDGSFVYVSRISDTMRISGYLVSPAEIEDVLQCQPGVADAQVVAIEFAGRTRPVAFVRCKVGVALDEASLLAAVAAVLAPFKVPLHVWQVDAFPASDGANGTKVQRSMLRAMALARLK
ncbi:AMP-binding protein [Variovorax paradoxus]|uniref:AMP-binding protein n=1 Tax=Variovorax paradoxus TaxID=34073 RepID=UPI0019335828|nr:AMP-binding protein [Variovorax paradoxus]